jgi:hypothetical protein
VKASLVGKQDQMRVDVTINEESEEFTYKNPPCRSNSCTAVFVNGFGVRSFVAVRDTDF